MNVMSKRSPQQERPAASREARSDGPRPAETGATRPETSTRRMRRAAEARSAVRSKPRERSRGWVGSADRGPTKVGRVE